MVGLGHGLGDGMTYREDVLGEVISSAEFVCEGAVLLRVTVREHAVVGTGVTVTGDV